MFTIAFVTARHEPRFDWFFQSLAIQQARNVISQIIIVDFFAQVCDGWTQVNVDQRRATVIACARQSGFNVQWVPPKPSVWSGPYRLPKENWWSASSTRNTAICFCKNDWIAFLDDRCVLDRNWLQAVLDAAQGPYVILGTYMKVNNCKVERGDVVAYDDIGCRDHRIDQLKLNPAYHGTTNPYVAGREWCFTCSIALPLPWALHINGFDEMADSLSGEDTAFGIMLANNGMPMKFDTRMSVIQDRTPGQSGPLMKRTDKGVSPADKSHGFVDNIRRAKRATHWINLARLREAILRGEPFPVPTGPRMDWWDQQPIETFA